MSFPASIELGTITRRLPSDFHTGHAVLDVATAYALGFADRLWSRTWAMHVAFRANMDAHTAYGNGNRAKRRAKQLAVEGGK